MGKGRDKRRRKGKRGGEVRTAKPERLGESFASSDPYTTVLETAQAQAVAPFRCNRAS